MLISYRYQYRNSTWILVSKMSSSFVSEQKFLLDTQLMDTSGLYKIINFGIVGTKFQKWREIYCTAYMYFMVLGWQVYMCLCSCGIACTYEKWTSIWVDSNKPSSIVALSTCHTLSPYVNDQGHISKRMIQRDKCSWELKVWLHIWVVKC